MANKHISYNSLFLLLLLLPLANSIEDILLNQEITQKELKAVKGDISAVYIIRAIDERAKALKILKNKCRISQTHDVKLWQDSKLEDDKIDEFVSGLAEALKSENKIPYLKDVEELITNFETSVSHGSRLHHSVAKSATWAKELLLRQKPVVDSPKPLSLVEKCKKLRQEHVDFLEQIKLELTLHFTFVKSHDFVRNTEIIHAYYKHLLNLNNATENVHKKMVALLISPQKNGDTFLTTLSEVAQKAKSETPIQSNGENPYEKLDGKNYLRKIFEIAKAVATLRNDPTFRKLIEQKDLKEIDGNIVEKLEMPRELYERMEAQAHFSNHKPSELTEEMGKALVELVVAQTLLVYERLNKFYKIDDHYKMWKYEEMPEEDHLKFYFDKFGGRNGDKKEKKEKQTAVAASPAAGIITSKPF